MITGRYYDCAYAAFPYTGTIKTAMIQFRSHIQKPIGAALTAVLARNILDMSLYADCILCVPIGNRKDRSFHPAEFVAKQLSGHIHVPFYPNIIAKTKKVKHCTERIDLNIRGMYKITQPEKIRGKNIILVDDLFIGGRTAIENARILKKCGAKTVWVFTLSGGK